jgi:hypothetical protein
VLRSDGRRLQSLRPDGPETQGLKALVWARKDLIGHRIAMANQLRANLLAESPAPVFDVGRPAVGVTDLSSAVRKCQPTCRHRAWDERRRDHFVVERPHASQLTAGH